MNKARHGILAAGVVAALAMITFPPWTGTTGRLIMPANIYTELIRDEFVDVEYAPVWRPPGGRIRPAWNMRIHYPRLAFQLAALAGIVTLLLLISGGSPRQVPTDRDPAAAKE